MATGAPRRWTALLRSIHPAEGVVFGAYLVAAFLLPTSTNVPIHDDGIYAWMAESFSRGDLVFHPFSAAAALFETIGGGVVLRVFDGDLGTLRWASVLLTLAGGLAVAVGVTALGVLGWWRALAAGSFLFNPIGFALSYSYQTDAHAVALAAMAIACWLWALRPQRLHLPLLAAGAGFAAIAVTSRQPALALAVGAAGCLVLQRRRPTLVAVAIVTVPSAAALLADQVWIGSQPAAQQDTFFNSLLDFTPFDLAVFVRQITAAHVVYLIAMLLPLSTAVALGAPASWRRISRPRRLGLAVAVAVGAATIAALPGDRFPYVPSWFSVWGLGSWDLNGLPQGILTGEVGTALTVVICALAFLVGLVAFDRWPPLRALGHGETLCATVLVAAVLFTIPSSAAFRSVLTLDRYLLPASVPAVLLLGRAVRGRTTNPVIPTAVLAAVAAFSISATYDSLSFHRAIAHLDAEARVAGVQPVQIDAGPGLTTYRSHDLPPGPRADNPRPTWWTISAAPTNTAEWIIASTPAPGYEVVSSESYPTILQTKPSALYLLRRLPHAEGP